MAIALQCLCPNVRMPHGCSIFSCITVTMLGGGGAQRSHFHFLMKNIFTPQQSENQSPNAPFGITEMRPVTGAWQG